MRAKTEKRFAIVTHRIMAYKVVSMYTTERAALAAANKRGRYEDVLAFGEGTGLRLSVEMDGNYLIPTYR